MPNTTSKSNKSKKRERSFISPSPAFSIGSVASSTGSISELVEDILKNPNNQPIATNLQTMQKEVSEFKPYKVKKIFRKFKDENKSKTGGKKNKRITIKKKKSRKTLKKPMFKRNK